MDTDAAPVLSSMEQREVDGLADYYRVNPQDDAQMNRWLGHRDAFAQIIIYCKREAGWRREDARRLPANFTRRRAVLEDQADMFDRIRTRFELDLEKVRRVYAASDQGRLARKQALPTKERT